MIAITLPVGPSVNHCYVTTRQGRRVLSAEARRYVETAVLLVRAEAARSGLAISGKARLCLTARIWFERDNRDADNALKLPVDALAEALGINDRWIKEWHIYSAVDKRNPRIEVELKMEATNAAA